MKKSIGFLVAVAMGLLTVTGCGNAQTNEDAGSIINEQEVLQQEDTNQPEDQQDDTEQQIISGPVVFTDSLGREITIENPERVVTLLGSFCDTWMLAGGQVVGTVKDSWTAFDLELSEDVVNLGSMLSPDLEQLVALEPDFVIASSNNDAQLELLDTLESAGVVVAYFTVSDFDEYLDMLDILTDITGRKDLYQQNGVSVAEEIQAVKDEVAAATDGKDAPTVLFIRAAASSVKAKGSEGTVGGEILAELGCINIADSDSSLLEELSLEAIVAADPDYIFVTTQGEDTEAALLNVEELLKSNEAWSSLSAVANGNYYEIDKALYNSKPNARWGEAYRILAEILYLN